MDEHYFKEKTEVPLQLGIVTAVIRKKQFDFYTSPPVFSWRRVDNGTICLANGMQISETDKTLLDLGCGYGVLGIVAAETFSALKVTMIDSSERAAFLARKNAIFYNLRDRVKVLDGDLYGPVEKLSAFSLQPSAVSTEGRWPKAKGQAVFEKFYIILSNPPYSAGKEIVNQIISHAPEHLNPGGSLQIVGRHNKGGRMYMGEMEKVFKNVTDDYKKSGFRVYVGRN